MIHHIFLDMDGVLADFVSAAFRVHCKPLFYDRVRWSFYEEWGITEEEFWAEISKYGTEFWSGLKKYAWFNGLIDLVSRYPWDIATTPAKCPHSSAGKIQWLYDNIGHNFSNYVMTPKKEYLAAPGVVLIDDNDHNCEKFRAAGGHAVLFPQPWNENRDKRNCPLKYVFDCLESIDRECCVKTGEVAARDNANKPQLDEVLLFGHSLSAVARVMEQGSKKYSPHNWLKGGKPDGEYIGSAMRHMVSHQLGEKYDPESGCLHAAHAAWNMLAMIRLNMQPQDAEIRDTVS